MNKKHHTPITVEDAILQVWLRTPKIFNAIVFCNAVKLRLTVTRTEGTILRILRKLRQKDILNYSVLHKAKCIYKKEKPNKPCKLIKPRQR